MIIFNYSKLMTCDKCPISPHLPLLRKLNKKPRIVQTFECKVKHQLELKKTWDKAYVIKQSSWRQWTQFIEKMFLFYKINKRHRANLLYYILCIKFHMNGRYFRTRAEIRKEVLKRTKGSVIKTWVRSACLKENLTLLSFQCIQLFRHERWSAFIIDSF